ncbi:hypothetical protein O4J56_25890 [Nocardiopsis sp. RSe5-2]|uniref:Uncharacterized protein n=1 Tax=Nocardiopsis endophytica TaxID=3018445 RepID=A0ABT4UAV9_9ACTN|nr:hypothetical protein [Nocardiopsis endophytica]MDA2814105.1 hypothetical protein [Nocardiopsis endophytica]
MNGPDSGANHAFVVVVIAPDERSAEITIAGRTQVVTGETPRQTRSGAMDAAASYAAHLGRPVLVNARDANGSWQLSVSPTGVVQSVGGTDAELIGTPEKKKGSSGKGRIIALSVVGGVLVLGLLGGGGYLALGLLPSGGSGGGGGGGDDGGTVVFDSRPAPPGFSDEAVWTRVLASESNPAVAPDGGSAVFVSEEGALTVVDPDGEERWTSELPEGVSPKGAAPYFVVDGDGYGVALLDDGTLWQWPADGGDPVETAIPDGARVSFPGHAPLVEDGGEAFIPEDGELAPVDVPEGYGAMLNDGRNVLTAVRSGPWEWVGPGGEQVEPEEPEGADDMDELLTARAETVVVVWSAGGGESVLAVHDSRDGSVIAQSPVDPDDLEDARWVEGDGVAAYGPVVFDLDGGAAHDVGLTPLSASGDWVFGELDGESVAVDSAGEPTVLEENTARPWGILGDRAVVVSGDSVYALSPE